LLLNVAVYLARRGVLCALNRRFSQQYQQNDAASRRLNVAHYALFLTKSGTIAAML